MSKEEILRALKGSMKTESFEASQKQYDERSTVYDEQHKRMGIMQALNAAKLCLKYVSNPDVATLLDVGAGRLFFFNLYIYIYIHS